MKINGKPDGGGSAVIEGLSITSNGTYTAGAGVDGYSPVEVDVQPELQDKTVVENGEYIADQGYYGLGTVTVSVPSPQFVTESLSVSVNGTYTPGQGVDGYSQVVVDVPQSVDGFTFKNILENTYPSSVVYDNTVSFVKTQMFCSVSTVRTLDLPNCSYINTGAFMNCGFNTLSLPTCKRIGMNAFDECNYISYVSLPECSDVGGFANNYWNSYIDLPKCKEIRGNTFFENLRLAQISLPVCEIIGDSAFYKCSSSLTTADLPKCSRLDNGAFMSCYVLSQMSLGRCINLKQGALQHCSSLTELSINIGNYIIPTISVNTLANTPLAQGSGSIYVNAGNYNKWLASASWASLSSVFVSVGTTDPMLSFSDGLLYGETNILFSGYSSYLDVTINNTSITSLSFSQCKSVGSYCFSNQKSITDAIFPECTYVGGAAFSNCNSLTNVELPKCSFIGSYAFYNCNALSIISLPECTYISANAFNWLQQLASVYLPGSAFCSIWDSGVFSQYSLQTTLVKFYVNSALVDTYKNDSKWSWYSSRIFPIE